MLELQCLLSNLTRCSIFSSRHKVGAATDTELTNSSLFLSRRKERERVLELPQPGEAPSSRSSSRPRAPSLPGPPPAPRTPSSAPGGRGPRRPWLSLTRSPARGAPEPLCRGRAATAAVRALLAPPPAPRQRPPSAGSGPGPPREPGAQAGAMLQTKMAAPGKGAPLGP